MWNIHGDDHSKGRTVSRHTQHFQILNISAGQCASSLCEGNSWSFNWNTCFHPFNSLVTYESGFESRLIIKCGRYFRSKCARWRSMMLMSCASISRLYGMNLTSSLAYYWQGDQEMVPLPKSLRWGKRWPLWTQTLKTSSEWLSPWMFHIL